jgi:hypothetical protein
MIAECSHGLAIVPAPLALAAFRFDDTDINIPAAGRILHRMQLRL